MNLPEIGYSSSEERVSPLPASLVCRLPTSTSNTPRAHFRSPIEPRYARRMPPSDIDIQHSAYRWLQIHGDEAVAKARAKVEERRRKRDSEGADFWLRIIVAIGTLGEPPTAARH
jgi:hypothetical protein